MASIKILERMETGTFLRRLNRFMVEVELRGNQVLAHLPNSGRLRTVLVPQTTVFLQSRRYAGRKSAYDLFAVDCLGVPVIVDTRFSILATKMAIEEKALPLLEDYRVVGENVQVNHARLDFLLQRGRHRFFLEVKCVTQVVDHVAMFPDAPTTRGRKHLHILLNLAQKGFDTGILFSVQRPDANAIASNWEIDPAFSELLHKVVERGVMVFTQMLIFQPPDAVELRPNVPALQL